MVNQRRVEHKTPAKRQAEIKEIIQSKGVRLTPCPVCLHNHITVFETSVRLFVRTDVGRRPERFFTTAIVICQNCGLKTEFDGETLGLDEYRTDAFD